ncbi:MAG: MarR family transcriptional regulator [Planctomycetota bacterium]
MSDSRVDFTQSTACKIRQLAREIGAFTTKVLEPAQITSTEADFLYYLKAGERQPSVIARAMGVDASNLSRLIRRFEEREWVDRRVDNENRRQIDLTLTNEGKRVAEYVDPHAQVVQDTLHRTLTLDQVAALHDALGQISASIGQGAVREWAEESN